MSEASEPLEGVLEPWTRKVTITIEGTSYEVPENQDVIRILQYLGAKGLLGFHPGYYCWNGTCDNCPCEFRDPATGRVERKKTCRTRVEDGMEIVKLAPTMSKRGSAP
jgi:predicted molibdopterin-dependent oxidoreductase YjgC